jgi:hypothetical protein
VVTENIITILPWSCARLAFSWWNIFLILSHEKDKAYPITAHKNIWVNLSSFDRLRPAICASFSFHALRMEVTDAYLKELNRQLGKKLLLALT